MTPIKFPGHNTVFAKDQPEYLPLPAHVDREEGVVTSCWKLSSKERIKLFLTGKIYLRVMNFNKPLQPQLLLLENPVKEYNKE
jgi:hypothetical protein